MCYFAGFNKQLGEKHNGNFGALMCSPTNYDFIPRKRVRGFRELDSRVLKETGYVKVYAEPVVEPPPDVEEDDVKFSVIDLEAVMEERKKSTGTDNPVQPEPTMPVSFSMTTRSANNSPRRSVSQTKTNKGIEIDVKVSGGNRAQRRAASKLAKRQAAKALDQSKRKAVRGNSVSSSQAPKVVKLSGLTMGVRVE